MAKSATKVAEATTKSEPKKSSRSAGPTNTSKPPATLPASLVKSLPVSAEIMKHVREIENLMPKLQREVNTAVKGGVIQTARTFVVMHRMRDAIRSGEGKDQSVFKPFMQMYEILNKVTLPRLLETEGVTNVPLAEGFRVQMAAPFYASVKKGQTQAAYEWLRANGLGDLIKDNVNSSSLGAGLKGLLEEKNIEAPDDIFTADYVPSMSVVKT